MKLFALFAVMLLAFVMSPLTEAAKKEAPAVLNFTMKDIDGKDVNLAEKYAGKTILLVNVASKCGLTKQYTGLQKLYDTYKDKGFVIANGYGSAKDTMIRIGHMGDHTMAELDTLLDALAEVLAA